MRGVALPDPERLAADVAELMRQWRVPAVAPPVTVAWNARLATTAGRAFPRRGHIELNPHLLARAPAWLRTVLVHEAAHVACARLFGDAAAAHGRHWRGLMRLAGLPPAITHDIPVRPRRRRRYLYLVLCEACDRRRIGAQVRYAACRGCGAGDRFLVMRAPAGAAGRAALQALSVGEIRRRCAGGRGTES